MRNYVQKDAKCRPLTEQYVALRVVNPQIIRHIERCRKAWGLAKDEIRILDLGCGSGATVAFLHDRGYLKTYGAEVVPSYLENGKPLFTLRGHDPEDILRLVNDDGAMDFDDDFFHFVFSEQVFEHVEDLSGLAREVYRVTQPGGWSYHTFTASKTIMEGHYHLPLVHWLPKNRLRRWAMYALYSLGLRHQERHVRRMSVSTITEMSYTYSVNETFYRRPHQIQREVASVGLDVEFVTVDNPELKNLLGPLFPLTKFAAFRAIVEWVLLNFRRIELVTTKPGPLDSQAAERLQDQLSRAAS